jgi:polysaccharide biosynthesis protein PslH
MIVTTRLPMLLGKPDSFTVFKLIKFLSIKHSIVLVSMYESKSELVYLEDIEGYCAQVFLCKHSKVKGYAGIFFGLFNFNPFQINYFSSNKMQSLVRSVYEDFKPEIIYSHLIRSAQFSKNLKSYKILAYQISHTLNYQRLIKFKRKGLVHIFYSEEYIRVKKYERSIADYFDKILFIGISDYESIFHNNNNLDKVFISPHGVDLNYFSSKGHVKTNDTVLFPADFSPETNRDAAKWFCEKIYPGILEEFPIIKVIFAGRNPPRFLYKMARNNKNILVTGFVEDIRKYYEMADILINPVRACAGQQNKILTGMAMRLPVVSTFEANEGIGAINNNQILLSKSENPDDFVKNISIVFKDSELKRKIANNGYKLVQSNWSWELHFNNLQNNIIDKV